MPTFETAQVYPGQCLLEGTNLSEGRGCTRPFEIFGAPWIDGAALAAALQASDMAALDCFDDLLERHGDALDAQALAPLREAMDVFDTEAALAAVRRLQA